MSGWKPGMPCRVLKDGHLYAARVGDVHRGIAYVDIPELPGLPFAFNAETGAPWRGANDIRLLTEAEASALPVPEPAKRRSEGATQQAGLTDNRTEATDGARRGRRAST